MENYQSFIELLKEELVPAMGCTEPIALAYAASIAKKILGEDVLSVDALISGNIIKNVKSVVVPNTGGLKGIEASISAGIVAGKMENKLEVISEVSEEEKEEIRHFLSKNCIRISPSKSKEALDIQLTLTGEHHTSFIRICQSHTHVVCAKKDDEVLYEDNSKVSKKKRNLDFLSVESIYHFVNSMKIEDVKELLDRQIDYNWTIAQEGLNHSYGANIGSVLLKTYGDDVRVKARAYAAAGSDARMSGCELPVIINSGSGNQGMTASLPIIVFAKEMKVEDDLLYRSLALSNLITIHLKNGIGRLSAYCGAVSAGCGAGCGIAYLQQASFDVICHTLVNSIAIASGIVCDGAKPSCASKIAVSVDAGLMGYAMALEGQEFKDGEGLVLKGVENTIRNISRLSSKGMKKTDQEIIDIMCNC